MQITSTPEYSDNNPTTAPALIDTDAAAKFLGTTAATLKFSRHTGTLWGIPAPRHVKSGRIVRYRPNVLIAWTNDLPDQQNTIRPAGLDARC